MKKIGVNQALKEKWNKQLWYEYLKGTKNRALNLIGEYAEDVNPDVQTYAQAQVFLKRNIRAANMLAVFSDEQIKEAKKKIDEAGYVTKWTLETLLKYIF